MNSFYIIIKYITPFCPLAYLYSFILFGISTSYALLTFTQNVVFSIIKCKKWFCSLLDDLYCSHLHLNKHNISHGDSRCCVLMHDKHYVAIGSLLHTLLFLCLTVQWTGGVTQSLLYVSMLISRIFSLLWITLKQSFFFFFIFNIVRQRDKDRLTIAVCAPHDL